MLCDRYADSTLAYQGYGHGQPLEPLRILGDYATNRLMPDLTVYLDLDAGSGLARKQGGPAEEWNRFEQKQLAYHQQVRQGSISNWQRLSPPAGWWSMLPVRWKASTGNWRQPLRNGDDCPPSQRSSRQRALHSGWAKAVICD